MAAVVGWWKAENSYLFKGADLQPWNGIESEIRYFYFCVKHLSTKLHNSSVRCWIQVKHPHSWKTIWRPSQLSVCIFACNCHVLFLWNNSMVLIFILPDVAYPSAKAAGILCCLCHLIQWCMWNHWFWRYEGEDTGLGIFSLIKLLKRFFQLLK